MKLGVIGAGNMAEAILKGAAESLKAQGIVFGAYDIAAEKLSFLKQLGGIAFAGIEELVAECDAVLLAVKPQSLPHIAKALKSAMTPEKLIISIMAGITAKAISEAVGFAPKLVLVMPNTPLMLGAGASALGAVHPATQEDLHFVKGLFASSGLAVEIPADKMNEIIPVNGSSPAFFYEFARILASSAEQSGIPYNDGLKLVAQTMAGSAKMLLESGKTPQELIDMVCSPGGTTLAGMAALRDNGFERVVEAACGACVARAKELAAPAQSQATQPQVAEPKKGAGAFWYEDAFFYQIYPLGFCGAPETNDGITCNRIEKIAEWIPHISALGVDTIYLGPVFESDRHGYDTRDYSKIDCRLGTNQDFARVCQKLHESGIKIVLDGVFNHVGRGFWAFEDVLHHREHSQYKDWFHIDFNRQGQPGDSFWYEGWESHYELVKLNLQNPAVREHLFGCIAKWVQQFGIDGLRLDVAYMLNRDFMRALRGFAKSLQPDFFLLGEAIHGDYNQIVNPEMLDSCTNYECYKGVYSSINDGNMFEIAHSLNRQFGPENWTLYRGKHLLSFLDNHDVTRIASNLTNPSGLPAAYGLLFGMPGIPCVYYGSEWGEKAAKSQGDHALRPNFENPATTELTQWIRTLAAIRGQNPALRHGAYRQLYLTNHQLVFEREWAENRVIVCVNISPNPHETAVLPTSGKMFDLVAGGYIAFSGKLTLKPNTVAFLRCD